MIVSLSNITRYYPDLYSDSYSVIPIMETDPDGDYVSHEDYKILQDENDRLKAENKKLIGELECRVQ